MVAFDKGDAHFNYRVAGIAIHNGRVLLDRNTRNPYWVLPGGHPEMMELMHEAVRREIQEEIGAEVEVDRLLWIVENFFFKGKPIHELSFYFQVNLPDHSALLKSDGPFYGDEHGRQLIFQWYPIDEAALTHLPLYPSFLAQALAHLPNTPEHIIFEEYKQRTSGHKSVSANNTNTPEEHKSSLDPLMMKKTLPVQAPPK